MIYYIGGHNVNTRSVHMPTVTTRRWGDIPNITGETPPTDKNVELQAKYNIAPNDPQWVYEMCERIEDKKRKQKVVDAITTKKAHEWWMGTAEER